jgi:serine/threonine-protein kinase
MTLAVGTKLGPYEVIAAIGAGGMGEVYKARDTRLDRTVAIKVLPSHVASDPDLRQRFEREAKTLAALSHPHICPVFDVGASTPVRPERVEGRTALSPGEAEQVVQFLVMEYLEGETLAERLDRMRGSNRLRQGYGGPPKLHAKAEDPALALPEALRYAIEIADALDKAHRQGIIHRDFKPGNIMLTKNGAKLLDFGLAKLGAARAPSTAIGPGARADDVNAALTMSTPLTTAGSIIGTFQYMAPEQLEGKEADARTDIFALGATLYEMLTGKKAFEGKSQASLIAAILASEPRPLSTLEPTMPPALDRVVKKCLAKDPEERWQDARDLYDELRWIADGGSQPGAMGTSSGAVGTMAATRPSLSRRVSPVAATAVLVALVSGVSVWFVGKPAPGRVVRLEATPPAVQTVGLPGPNADIAFSPDGRHVVYVTGPPPVLYVRALDELEATPLLGLGNPVAPFLSPDGNWIAFADGATLKKVTISGGPPVTICDTCLARGSGIFRGASWGPDDTIVFATAGAAGGLFRVPAGGGEHAALTKPDPQKGEVEHIFPEILPGGQAVLFTIRTSGPIENAQIAVLDLRTGEQNVLVSGGSNPRYAASGHIVYGVAGTLRAIAFDLDRLGVRGDPVPALDRVITKGSGAANFSFSRDGSLAYLAGDLQQAAPRSLVWVDRDGREEKLPLPDRVYRAPRVSPDGRRLAILLGEQDQAELWVYEIATGAGLRLTHGGNAVAPVWTPDGKRIIFGWATGSNDLFWVPADGSGEPERVTPSDEVNDFPTTVSPDGRSVLFARILDVNSQREIWRVPLEGDRKPEPVLQGRFSRGNAELSPDGRWLAYRSNESGSDEVYLQAYPELGAKRPISISGGEGPVWSPDGRQIFYRAGNKMMAVAVGREAALEVGSPVVVWERPYFAPTPAAVREHHIGPDGRFLMMKAAAAERAAAPRLIVVLNWLEELKRLVPGN